MIKKVWPASYGRELAVSHFPVDNADGIQAGDFVDIRKIVPVIRKTKCAVCTKPYADHTVRELYDHRLLEEPKC